MYMASVYIGYCVYITVIITVANKTLLLLLLLLLFNNINLENLLIIIHFNVYI